MSATLANSMTPVPELAGTRRTALIVGPPWPRSGTARVIQNQIDFYRARGYSPVFICVPVHCSYNKSYSEWDVIEAGMQELNADQIFFARIDDRSFRSAKYVNWIKHGFRGTALDWIVMSGNCAKLPRDAVSALREKAIAIMNVNHVFTFDFALRLLRQLTSSGGQQVPVILDTHDVQAHLLRERCEVNPWTHRVDTVERLLKSELLFLQKAGVLVHCSVDDCNFFQQLLPLKSHVLALPTIDESFVLSVDSGDRSANDPIDLLFVGQSTDANCAAMKWFFGEVWPLIADRKYRVKIVGQVDMLVRKNLPEIYERFRSTFVGPVEDLAPYYRSARCVFAPMISGTGVSIKTIEALALGKPFVGTSRAYRGMPIERLAQTGLQAFDTPQSFANALVRALSDEEMFAAASRNAYTTIFSRDAAFASRDAALRSLCLA